MTGRRERLEFPMPVIPDAPFSTPYSDFNRSFGLQIVAVPTFSQKCKKQPSLSTGRAVYQ
ncbi:hypothetical protein [Paenibacillus sp. FSL H8-0034]|uniref:hypothetical protein n=1 Tax=Paenibacillus sp. FSL H8-0034 TaxID=2954671 RepID=UPI0030F8A702